MFELIIYTSKKIHNTVYLKAAKGDINPTKIILFINNTQLIPNLKIIFRNREL